MKKANKLSILSILLILILISFLGALSKSDQKSIDNCKKQWNKDKTESTLFCNSEFKNCNGECNLNYQNCLNGYKLQYENCKKNCSKDRNCLNNCSLNYNKRKTCDKQPCMNSCNLIKSSCFDVIKFKFSDSPRDCVNQVLNQNASCENGKYKSGEVFLQDCSLCKCNYNSNVTCKATDFCNFEDPVMEKGKCVLNGGLYQQLCNGPYFDIMCSKDNFCICEGNGDYTCPEDYVCIKNFTNSLTRKYQTIPGWKDYIGKPLGDIGICVKKPILANCGNGVCENAVCMSLDCTDAETKFNCPQDCS